MKVWGDVGELPGVQTSPQTPTLRPTLFHQRGRSVMIHEPVMNTCKGYIAIALSFAACMLLARPALAQETERPAQMKELPQAVQATVREQNRGAVMRGLSIETENDQTFYEASLKVKGRIRDVLIDPTGAVGEIEEQVTVA